MAAGTETGNITFLSHSINLTDKVWSNSQQEQTGWTGNSIVSMTCKKLSPN